MARNFNAHNHVDTRVVSSWLHEIPSDAGGGSEATLIAPSVYEEPSPRRRKDQVQPTKPQPQTPKRYPIRTPNPNTTPKQNAYPAPTPTPNSSSPIRGRQPQPRPNSTPNNPTLNPTPNPAVLSPPNPESPPVPLREQITTNFTTHCPTCNPPPPLNPPPPSPAAPTAATCARCAAAKAYTNRTHHSTHFLSTHLLPISRELSFDETVAYLNQAIVARLAGVLARGGGKGGDTTERGVARTWPTLDDFDLVRGVARVRGEVMRGFEIPGEGWGLGVDRFGIVRDRGPL